MYRLIEVGHLFTTVYWWACATVGVTNRNIAARDSSRDAMMNMEANRENSWVGAPSFYGGHWRIRIVKQGSPGPFIDSDQYSTEVCWSGVEDKRTKYKALRLPACKTVINPI